MEDMRGFISRFRDSFPSLYYDVKREIDPAFEITALQKKFEKKGEDPLLFFSKVKGTSFPVAANVYGNRKRLAWALDTSPENIADEYSRRQANRIPPVYTEDAPCQEVVHRDEEVDLLELPQIKAYEGDVAPYISSGILIANDPLTGVRNASFNRLMVVNRNTVYTHLGPGRHAVQYYMEAEKRGKSLPVSISLGTHPLWALGCLSLIPIDEDELEVMGGMAGEPVRLAKGVTGSVDVLADAEIVLEGEILPYERGDEGPYCEFTGYATGTRKRHVIRITAVTHRKGAIYQSLIAGTTEHLVIGAIPREAGLFEAARRNSPVVRRVHVPESGCGRFHVYVSISKTAKGQGKNVALSILAADPFVKMVVVVDDDIDVFDEKQVLWAVATRVQADRDLAIIPGALGSDLDPSADEDGVGSKLIIDATAKPFLKEFHVKASIPEEVLKRVAIDDLK